MGRHFIFRKQVGTYCLYKIIIKMKINKATGCDNVPPKMI